MELKSTCCIIGAVLINLTLGTFYSYGNVIPYIASYMRNHNNPDVVAEDGIWITSAFLLGQGLFLIVGSYIEQLFDNRIACIVGCILHSMSTYLTIWALDYNILMVVLLYGFCSGLGCGSAYIASIIAAQKWNPHRKGLFTGIIVAGFGFGGLIFTSLQTLYMNPDNKVPNELGYFDSTVYDRVPRMFLYMGIMFTVIQTIGCIISFPPPELNQTFTEIKNGPTNVHDDVLPNMRSVLSAFKYRVFYITGFMMMAVAPGVTLVNSLGKRYGQIHINDDRFLGTVVAIAAVANASGRLTWGFLTDKLSFSTCYFIKIVLFAALIASFPFDFILSSRTLYTIWMLGLFFGFSGTFVLFPLFVEQVFGARYHGIVYGTLYLLLAASSILTSLVIKSFIDVKGSRTARVFACELVAALYLISLVAFRFLLPVDRLENAVRRRKEAIYAQNKNSLSQRKDLAQNVEGISKENSLGSIVRFADQ